MADERRDVEEVEGVEGEELEELPKKKGKFKLILLIVFLVIGMGLGATYYFYGDKLINKYLGKYVGGAQKTTEKKKEKTIGPIMALEPFLFNLSGSVSKFAKISISIEFKDPKVMEEAKKMTPVLRDKVLSVLGSKGPDILMDINNRDAIKKELYDVVKVLFKHQEDVNAVYITDIIIQ